MMHHLSPLLVRHAVVGLRHAPVVALGDASATMALTRLAADASTKLSSCPTGCAILYGLSDLLIPFNTGLAPIFGALFDFPTALLVVLCGGIASAAAAFFIGRLFQTRFLEWVSSKPTVFKQFGFVDRAISNGGFLAVLLLRLIPTPIPALNFLYGLTSVHAPAFLGATVIGNLPGSAAIVSSAALGKHFILARGRVTEMLGGVGPWQAGGVGIVALATVGWGAKVAIAGIRHRLVALAGPGEECVTATSMAEQHYSSEYNDDGRGGPLGLAADGDDLEGCIVDESTPWRPFA